MAGLLDIRLVIGWSSKFERWLIFITLYLDITYALSLSQNAKYAGEERVG